jgi:hypothetical protein
LAIGMAIAVVVGRRKLSQDTLMLSAISATAAAMMFAAYFLVDTQYIAIRHAAILFAPVVLALAVLCSNILENTGERVLRPLISLAAVAVLVFFTYSLVTLYPNATKRGDWARVAQFIKDGESPGQPVMVFTTMDALSLSYYYSGANRILPDERFFDFQAPEAAPGSSESLARETQFTISQIPTDAEHIWLVVNEKCLVTRACTPLQNYVSANYTIDIERDFYLERVYLLRKKQ